MYQQFQCFNDRPHTSKQKKLLRPMLRSRVTTAPEIGILDLQQSTRSTLHQQCQGQRRHDPVGFQSLTGCMSKERTVQCTKSTWYSSTSYIEPGNTLCFQSFYLLQLPAFVTNGNVPFLHHWKRNTVILTCS